MLRWQVGARTVSTRLEPIGKRNSVSLSAKSTLSASKNYNIRSSPEMIESPQATMDDALPPHHRFKYQSLDSERNEIRLLRISPNPDLESRIHCQLFHTSLENAPPYQALSYVWGSSLGSNVVYIDSGYAKVTANLEHALRRLRPQQGSQELIMWVDALCINQEDIPERSLQTSKMRMIYEKAEGVSIWLGRRNTVGMSLVRDLNQGSREDVSRMIRDPKEEERFIALLYLFRKTYWWRIWVIQEVACAAKATVYCEDESMPWSEMDSVATILRESEDDFQHVYYKSPSLIRTLTHGGPRSLGLSQFSSNSSAPPLLDLLLSHKSKHSTDPRDKVYALVGISAARDSFGKIDYSRSLREVFSHTTRHIISNSHKLDVICVKQHDWNETDISSWVPDWTRPPANIHMVVGLHHHEPQFTAAGTSPAQFSFLQDGYVLKATGFALDRVKAVGHPFKKRFAANQTLPSLSALQDWWKVYVAHLEDSASDQGAFLRIISCGNWNFDNDAIYEEKLKAIFAFSKRQLIHSSAYPAPEEKMDRFELPYAENSPDEKAQVAAILSAGLMMNRRRLFVGSSNIAGLAPWNSEPGDMICILLGCRSPVVLRRLGHRWPYHYQLIGEAYVDGMMDGEAMLALDRGEFVLEDFEIH